jgi:quercetin dioxygenase-like cupin family protein
MIHTTRFGRLFRNGLICAGMIAASAALAASANAGSCPTDKVKPNVRAAVDTPASGVTDDVLAAIDLANEAPKLVGSQMRVRKLVIQPGGVVPWHSHGERPALIYIIEGEIVEYASNCETPIVHKAGEVSRESNGTTHWWKNHGDKTVTLLSFDIRRDPKDHNM